jgi:biotin synthase
MFMPSIQQLRSTGASQKAFHEDAFEEMATRFGRSAFVRGVVEVSNFCRENCSYCGMRRDNKSLSRFRAHYEQLAEMIINHRPPTITDLNIQAGEDPVAVREVVLPLIRALRTKTNLGISVCLGTLPEKLYAELKSEGASIYIIKFEIGDPTQYISLHAPGTYDERLSHIRHLAETGWNVSSGFIAGLPGQTDAQLLKNFEVANELPLEGCSVSPFIPGDETPLCQSAPADIDLTLNSMAALRLMKPSWVIPAVSALNLAEPGNGYRRGLETGANLVTINMTPDDVRGDYLLYKRERFIMNEERILKAMEAVRMTASKVSLAEHYRRKRAQGSQAAAA